MKTHSAVAWLGLTFAASAAPEPSPVAFPGAEGAGRVASGGRGGAVYHVTNLHASGPGSLADAVSGPDRTVVFDVSGVIDMAVKDKKGGHIVVSAPNITIAGQSAPGEGICLKGGALQISAPNVIVRYLRSRRGFVRDEDTGDAIEVKAPTIGEKAEATGTTAQAFDKRAAKKAERGKFMHEFGALDRIVIDHCSTSWATDENLTVTHTDLSTVSYCIAAEGLDYANAKQTPPNHSEGSLWGSGAPHGRATMHHVLYANNRLRNPRTTGDANDPAVLNFYNNVVYNWSEYASHTGSESVLLNWLSSYYKAGPDTPADIRYNMFQFHGDPGARIYAQGNFIFGSPEATANNKLAISHNEKFRKVPPGEREAMKVDRPFPDAPAKLPSAEEAFATVLAEAGATLPARDAVDLRIVRAVRDGGGRIIQKETDLPENERWPEYRSLPPLPDADGDGIPDFWEAQFGLNPRDRADGSAIAAGGYSNLEHYLNNSDPSGRSGSIVSVSATVSRVRAGQEGEWRLARTGPTDAPLTVHLAVSGDAQSGRDFAPVGETATIPAGQRFITIPLHPLKDAVAGRMAVLSLTQPPAGSYIGCPSVALIVFED